MKKISIIILSFFLVVGVTTVANSQININKFKNKAKQKVKKATKDVTPDASTVTKKASPAKTTQSNSNNSNDKVNSPKGDKTWYVSKKGSNKNDGTKGNPLKNIDKAIAKASPGDKICIARGIYSGTFNIGYLESDIPVKLYGSFNESFSEQDIINHPTVFQPDNASGAKSRKALLRFQKEVAGTVIDNIVWDMGMRNAYSSDEGIVKGLETGRMLSSTERPAVGSSTVEEPCISIRSGVKGGDVTIQNCVFVNGANFGVQAALKSGTYRIINNVFVANKMASIEVFGTCKRPPGPGNLNKCGHVEIANNTILFTWSRLKDLKDMGYGIRIMTQCEYDIHDNIIGGSVLAGVDHSRFNKDEWINMNNNIFFVNKRADFYYTPQSNTSLNLFVNQFEDLELGSIQGNLSKIPDIPVNKTYLDAFLNVSYSEKVNYDANSPANQWREAMGMNKQGTIQSKVSMFMNRYPWKETLLLFGAHKKGAQVPGKNL